MACAELQSQLITEQTTVVALQTRLDLSKHDILEAEKRLSEEKKNGKSRIEALETSLYAIEVASRVLSHIVNPDPDLIGGKAEHG